MNKSFLFNYAFQIFSIRDFYWFLLQSLRWEFVFLLSNLCQQSIVLSWFLLNMKEKIKGLFVSVMIIGKMFKDCYWNKISSTCHMQQLKVNNSKQTAMVSKRFVKNTFWVFNRNMLWVNLSQGVDRFIQINSY